MFACRCLCGAFGAMALMLEAEGRWEPADLPGSEGPDSVDDAEAPVGEPRHEAASRQRVEVDGEFEGAAAMCSGGESTQVGDRSRSDDGDPESAHVGVRRRIPRRIALEQARHDIGPLEGSTANAAGRRVRYR